MLFLAVLKPDGVMRKAAGAGILQGLMDSGLCEFRSFQRETAPKELLDVHYHHVSQRSFYPWLARYMSAYPSYVILLEASAEKIDEIRKLLGATRAHLAEPGTLRYQYCPYGGANGLHLSEDAKAGEHETALWRSRLGLQEGKFDLPVAVYIRENIHKPNHTFGLRDIFLDVEAGKLTFDNDQEQKVKALLREESPDASHEEIEFLYWALTEPVSPGA